MANLRWPIYDSHILKTCVLMNLAHMIKLSGALNYSENKAYYDFSFITVLLLRGGDFSYGLAEIYT